MTDQAVLRTIVLSDEDYDVRIAAIGHLTDQAALFQLAQGAPNHRIRKRIIQRLKQL